MVPLQCLEAFFFFLVIPFNLPTNLLSPYHCILLVVGSRSFLLKRSGNTSIDF